MSDSLTERLHEVVQKAWANGWWEGRVQRDVAEAADRIDDLEAALREITCIPSPTVTPAKWKEIARRALEKERYD